MNLVTIYALTCPLCGRLCWVGKTTERMERRLSKHLKHSTGHYNPPKRRWLDRLAAHGLKPGIFAIERVPADDWKAAETFWIRYMRSIGVTLYNRRMPC